MAAFKVADLLAAMEESSVRGGPLLPRPKTFPPTTLSVALQRFAVRELLGYSPLACAVLLSLLLGGLSSLLKPTKLMSLCDTSAPSLEVVLPLAAIELGCWP